MSKNAGVSGGGSQLNILEMMANNPEMFTGIGGNPITGAAATEAEAPAPTPMTTEEFYGMSNGRIGQPDQDYFNQFVLPGSQGYAQPQLMNPMARGRAVYGANPTRAEFGAIDERYYR
ncbi:MAG: hypothetical protein L7S55_09075 [Luminiphilus sp.]|nr:hypothetical protein [Luminiphilus sp.]